LGRLLPIPRGIALTSPLTVLRNAAPRLHIEYRPGAGGSSSEVLIYLAIRSRKLGRRRKLREDGDIWMMTREMRMGKMGELIILDRRREKPFRVVAKTLFRRELRMDQVSQQLKAHQFFRSRKMRCRSKSV